MKFEFEQFFRTREVKDIADFIATKIESSETYYVHKNRNGEFCGSIIDSKTFNKQLEKSKRPIILSDTYIKF